MLSYRQKSSWLAECFSLGCDAVQIHSNPSSAERSCICYTNLFRNNLPSNYLASRLIQYIFENEIASSESGFLLTLTHPSIPIVISSPSSRKNCSIIPWWHVFFPFLAISALISPPSHNSIFPHSDPDKTFPSGNSTNPSQESKSYVKCHTQNGRWGALCWRGTILGHIIVNMHLTPSFFQIPDYCWLDR